jgi:hypothetical protein
MISWLITLMRLALAGLKSHRNSLLEILPLRHQLRDLRRSPIRLENYFSSYGVRGAPGFWLVAHRTERCLRMP